MGNRHLQFAVSRLQFHVAGISNFARRSLFNAAMFFFFVKSKYITFIAQKTGIIHLFKFKNQTSTLQTDKESYFVPLIVKLYNFKWKNPCRKSLTAGCPSCRSNVNCKLQTRPQSLPSPCTAFSQSLWVN